MISIRLSKSLIEDFKNIASIHGLGYQPLMRQALERFADGEKRMLLHTTASEHAKHKRQRDADKSTRKNGNAPSAAPVPRTREKKTV